MASPSHLAKDWASAVLPRAASWKGLAAREEAQCMPAPKVQVRSWPVLRPQLLHWPVPRSSQVHSHSRKGPGLTVEPCSAVRPFLLYMWPGVCAKLSLHELTFKFSPVRGCCDGETESERGIWQHCCHPKNNYEILHQWLHLSLPSQP